MNWINIKDELPEPGKQVILFQRVNGVRKVPIMGFYAPAKTLEYDGSDEWGYEPDYDEETDKYYIEEGFYESIENWDDISFITIPKNEVTHWKPLPKSPGVGVSKQIY